MGRIKTQTVKRNASELVKRNPGYFTTNFKENTEKVKSVAEIKTKKFRNTIVGCITKTIKKDNA